MKILILLMIFSVNIYANTSFVAEEVRVLEEKMSWKTEKLYWMLEKKWRNDSERVYFLNLSYRDQLHYFKYHYSGLWPVYINKRKTSRGIF